MSVEPDLRPTEPGPTRPADPLLPPPFGEATRPASVLVLLFLMLIGMLVVGSITQLLFGFTANALITEVGVILLPVLVVLRSVGPWKALSLDRRPEPRALLLSMLGVLGLAVILAQLTHWTDRIWPMPELFKQLYIDAITAHSPAELMMLVVAVALIPGACEEVAFRGYFQQVFACEYGSRRGVVIAAALFAVIHFNPWHLPALFLIGLYLGYLFVWTGSLWAPILAHATNNAASILLVNLSGEHSLSQMAEAPPLWVLALGTAAFAAAVLGLRRMHRDGAVAAPQVVPSD